MEPEVVVPLLLAASAYMFFASLIHSFRSDISGGARVNLILAAVCSAPWILLVLGAALFPNGAFDYAAYFFLLIGPFIALFSIGFFLAGRVGIGGWRKDALAMALSVLFGGLVYLLATANS